jgi:hypothetical protein
VLETDPQPFAGGLFCFAEKPRYTDPRKLLFSSYLPTDLIDEMEIPSYVQFNHNPGGWRIYPKVTQGFSYEAYVVYGRKAFCSDLQLLAG